MFLTKDILIYFSITVIMVLLGLKVYIYVKANHRGVVISVDPVPMTTAVFILYQT